MNSRGTRRNCADCVAALAAALGLLAALASGSLPPAVALAQPQSRAGSDSPKKNVDRTVVARVDGRPIYAAQVDRMVERVLGKRQLAPAELSYLRARTLEQLVSRELILTFLQQHQAAASEQDIALERARMEKKLKQQNVTVAQYIASANLLDEDDLKHTLAWQLGWQRFLDRWMTDDNLKKHFERYHRQFDGTQLELAHILLKVEPREDPAALRRALEQARKLRGEIEAGKLTFAATAKQYSQAPTAGDGGGIGRISRHKPMPESFSAAAYALKTGEVSEPVVTNAGVHLIQCVQEISGQRPFSEVRDQVEADARRFLFDWVVARQRPDSQVEYTGAAPHLKPGTDEVVGQ